MPFAPSSVLAPSSVSCFLLAICRVWRQSMDLQRLHVAVEESAQGHDGLPEKAGDSSDHEKPLLWDT